VNELAAGTLLGHYKIVRRLGQGGMGVVYEAADQKLGRHVAVKLLTEATRDSSAALERFWREARAASSLNHPGICTIYELNETAESPFIVMELLEGSSLEKLYRGHAMPYPKLVEMGVQLADALDAAHRKGILHRDIKPANIFVTNSGQAKLLDFGLAKLEGGANDGQADDDAPTAVDPLTNEGSSVGTVAYMSPEQARGEPLDARSDLFSLGVVLYEMATGKHPFTGTTTAVVFDRILNHAPVAPVSLNAQLPVEFENILNKTLEKDRDLRCQSAAELRADLKRLQRKSSSGNVASSAASGSENSQNPASGTSNPFQPVAGASSSGTQTVSSDAVAVPAVKKSRMWAITLAVVVVLAAAGFAVWRFWPRARPFASVSVNQITNIGTIERVALSADGRFLAEVKNDNGQRTLWVRNTATNTDTQILGAFGNEYVGLTFSPDGNYLYFNRGTPENSSLRALYVMSVFGGTPKQLIVDVDSTVSFSPDGSRFTYVRWTPDNKNQFSEIHIAEKDGSNNQVFYASPEQLEAPVWSPDGSQLAWLQTVADTTRIALGAMDIATKKLTTITAPADVFLTHDSSGYTTLAWLPDSRHLLTLYYKQHTDRAQIGVMTVPSGEFYPLTNDVNAYRQLALSGDGRTLATVLTNVDSSVGFYGPDGGTAIASLPLRITPSSIAWANEDRLVFIVGSMSIGSLDRTTGNLRTFDVGEIDLGYSVAACPDGHILFTGFPKGGGQARLFRMNADGGDLVQLTTSGIARTPSCSLDSKVAYFSLRTGTNISLWSIPVAGGTPKQLLPPDNYLGVGVSADGKLAYLLVFRGQENAVQIVDLASGHAQPPFVFDQSLLGAIHHTPDNRAIVTTALRDGGNILLYQPIDGSASHALLAPTPETIRDFGWSPSGKQLAVARVKSSSDVVLITDQAGNGKN
jgi:eukaryotic-like serine/threonine-protein kinase